MTPVTLTILQQAEVIRRYRLAQSYPKIAVALGYDRQTVRDVIREYLAAGVLWPPEAKHVVIDLAEVLAEVQPRVTAKALKRRGPRTSAGGAA